jgi:hypothetical protein
MKKKKNDNSENCTITIINGNGKKSPPITLKELEEIVNDLKRKKKRKNK